MSFIKNIFRRNKSDNYSYEGFWNWFVNNQKDFWDIIKNRENIEIGFIAKLSDKLNQIRNGYHFLVGMSNEETVELILTADGVVKNIVFTEELVNTAPDLKGWLFTALKPPLDISSVVITLDDYEFNSENLFFYPNENILFPDEIDITIVYKNYNEESKGLITNGCYLFLDNYIGELNFTTTIDNLEIVGMEDVNCDLIPIEKLKDYLNWREKEFVEKYEGVRRDTENDNHSILEATLPSGNNLLAVVNQELLEWDRKASHPWICIITLKYSDLDRNGMPSNKDYNLLSEFEEEIMEELIDSEGYLNIGRQTAECEREIYFAFCEFRKPSKVIDSIVKKYSNKFEIDFTIFKDKYWQSFNRFRSV